MRLIDQKNSEIEKKINEIYLQKRLEYEQLKESNFKDYQQKMEKWNSDLQKDMDLAKQKFQRYEFYSKVLFNTAVISCISTTLDVIINNSTHFKDYTFNQKLLHIGVGAAFSIFQAYLMSQVTTFLTVVVPSINPLFLTILAPVIASIIYTYYFNNPESKSIHMIAFDQLDTLVIGFIFNKLNIDKKIFSEELQSFFGPQTKKLASDVAVSFYRRLKFNFVKKNKELPKEDLNEASKNISNLYNFLINNSDNQENNEWLKNFLKIFPHFALSNQQSSSELEFENALKNVLIVKEQSIEYNFSKIHGVISQIVLSQHSKQNAVEKIEWIALQPITKTESKLIYSLEGNRLMKFSQYLECLDMNEIGDEIDAILVEIINSLHNLQKNYSFCHGNLNASNVTIYLKNEDLESEQLEEKFEIKFSQLENSFFFIEGKKKIFFNNRSMKSTKLVADLKAEYYDDFDSLMRSLVAINHPKLNHFIEFYYLNLQKNYYLSSQKDQISSSTCYQSDDLKLTRTDSLIAFPPIEKIVLGDLIREISQNNNTKPLPEKRKNLSSTFNPLKLSNNLKFPSESKILEKFSITLDEDCKGWVQTNNLLSPCKIGNFYSTTSANAILICNGIDKSETSSTITNDSIEMGSVCNNFYFSKLCSQYYEEGVSPNFLQVFGEFCFMEEDKYTACMITEHFDVNLDNFDSIVSKIEKTQWNPNLNKNSYIENALLQIICTLVQLEDNKIVHNDLNTLNILVKICDETIYKQKKLCDYEFFEYLIDNKPYKIPNYGFVIKLSDFSCSSSFKKFPVLPKDNSPIWKISSTEKLSVYSIFEDFLPTNDKSFQIGKDLFTLFCRMKSHPFFYRNEKVVEFISIMSKKNSPVNRKTFLNTTPQFSFWNEKLLSPLNFISYSAKKYITSNILDYELTNYSRILIISSQKPREILFPKGGTFFDLYKYILKEMGIRVFKFYLRALNKHFETNDNQVINCDNNEITEIHVIDFCCSNVKVKILETKNTMFFLPSTPFSSALDQISKVVGDNMTIVLKKNENNFFYIPKSELKNFGEIEIGDFYLFSLQVLSNFELFAANSLEKYKKMDIQLFHYSSSIHYNLISEKKFNCLAQNSKKLHYKLKSKMDKESLFKVVSSQLDLKNICVDPEDIKKKVVEHLKTKKDIYSSFVNYEWESYISKIEGGSPPCDYIILEAISELFEVSIKVVKEKIHQNYLVKKKDNFKIEIMIPQCKYIFFEWENQNKPQLIEEFKNEKTYGDQSLLEEIVNILKIDGLKEKLSSGSFTCLSDITTHNILNDFNLKPTQKKNFYALWKLFSRSEKEIFEDLSQICLDEDDTSNHLPNWAENYYIDIFMNQTLQPTEDTKWAVYIAPKNYSFDSEEGIDDALSNICKRKVGEDIINEHYNNTIQKPFVVIANTSTILSDSSVGTNTTGGSHWVSWVLLPKKYTSYSGKKVDNKYYSIYFFDSLGKYKFPTKILQGLTNGKKTGQTNLLPFCDKNEIKLFQVENQILQVNGSDCGWWSAYHSLMTVYTGDSSFLNKFETNTSSAKMLKKFMLFNQNDFKLLDREFFKI